MNKKLTNNISSIQKILLGLLVVTIDIFGIVDVSEIKNQKYLDLGYKYIVHIPRRNHILVPTTTNQAMIQEKRLIISNRLFEGSSTSNLNGNGAYGGGQCVQFTKNIYYPFKNGTRPEISQAYTNSNTGLLQQVYNLIQDDRLNLPNGIRERVENCIEGDIIAVDSGGGTGHIATYKSYDNNKLYLIQSNDDSDSLTMYGSKKEYKTDKDGYHERFTFGNIHNNPNTTYAISRNNNQFNMREPSNGSNTFVCFDESNYNFNRTNYNGSDYRTVFVDNKKTGNGTTSDIFATTYGYPANDKPWLYYLIDRKEDGVSLSTETKNNKSYHYYGYAPDLLPVAPLKLNDNNIMDSGKETKYEIYVTDNFGNKPNTKFMLYGFKNFITKTDPDEDNIFRIDSFLKFNDNNFFKLQQKDTNKTQFIMIPQNGVNDFNHQKELRIITKDTIIKTFKKVLFSPTVIDDYYIDWSHNNSEYNTSKIKIGFWNSNGYDMTFEGTYIDNGNSIVENSIYESSNAVNKYFMTLGKNKKAKWHFTLRGKHKFYVNIPTGNEDDIKSANYSYKGIVLKATKSEDNIDSDFSNWYILSKKNDTQVFDLNGSESVEVNTTDGTIVVDALKIVATTGIKTDKIKYPDTKNLDEESKKAIDYLSNTLSIFSGYDSGYKKGYFGVGDNISRAELSAVIALMLKHITNKSDIIKVSEKYIKDNYTDWNEPEWFMEHAQIVVGMNIMTGYFDEKKLKPLNDVTYRELSAIITQSFFYGKTLQKHWSAGTSVEKWFWHVSCYKCLNNDNKGYTYINDDKKKYTISSVFKQPNKTKIPGSSNGEGDLKATREDVALFLYRAYMLWKNKIETASCSVDEENETEGWGL